MLRRICTNSAPRLTIHPIDDPIARWLAAADAARADPSGQRIWQLYENPSFASLWYSARDAGERLRATALGWLYAHQAQPGGAYPDPREPGAFSQSAILRAAASHLHLTFQQSTNPSDLDGRLPSGPLPLTVGTPDAAMRQAWQLHLPQAWLVSYPQPRQPTQQQQQPIIMIYLPSQQIPQRRINFEIACMLGYVTKDAGRLLDRMAPPGISLMPTSPSAVALAHQFAIALLCLDLACPEEWGCHCNDIRRRFNAAPASHAQSTDTLDLAELAHEVQRVSRKEQE